MRYISVIGLGRVGLPLALSFADRGLRVLGVDHDPAVLASLRAGRMPFNEADTQELLDRVRRSGRLELTDRAADAAQAEDIVITIGTPSFSHVESDLRQVRAAVDDLLPLLRPGHSLILRSTIAPGTTEFVAGYIEKRRDLRVGEDVFVAHAPERIAAGRFLEEITHAAVHHRRRRARPPPSAPPACSACSAPRSSAPPRCRPSWPRSGPTSCATPPSRCPTC